VVVGAFVEDPPAAATDDVETIMPEEDEGLAEVDELADEDATDVLDDWEDAVLLDWPELAVVPGAAAVV